MPENALAVGRDHQVHFFETEKGLASTVASHFARALSLSGTAAAIATRAHHDLFLGSLTTTGIDVSSALSEGRLSFYDARETLDRIYGAGAIRPARFGEVIGALVRKAGAGGAPLHIYGEMVALLWDEGDVTAAMTLEGLWNDLSERSPFSLLCGYAAGSFDNPIATDAFSEVCHRHSVVIDGAPEPAHVDAFRRFPRADATPRSARRFVRDTLIDWDRGDLADEALLAVSELATNAILHARSNVSVGLARHDDVIRVIVGDTSTDAPVPRAADENSLNGRGLRMIDRFAQQWGHDVAHDGKLVWVDIRSPQTLR